MLTCKIVIIIYCFGEVAVKGEVSIIILLIDSDNESQGTAIDKGWCLSYFKISFFQDPRYYYSLSGCIFVSVFTERLIDFRKHGSSLVLQH